MSGSETNKRIAFSAVQPSGTVTLGNYLGAIKNWIPMQEEYKCIFFLADLHAITVRQDPEKFRKNIIEAYALFLSCGIDPQKSTFFIQSHVHTHAELAWILNCYTQFGELSRMTQFKDKSKKYSDNINAGLFCYPSLMAADILLYKPHVIPIGADQKQHVEITRDIANRFNGIYGETFILPEPLIPENGARIMSLQDPTKKMSKSDENSNAYISILDTPDVIVKKLKRAVTDSYAEVRYRDGEKTGVNNLLNIYCAISRKTISEAEQDFEGKGYGVLKSVIAEMVCNELKPIQDRFSEIMKDRGYIKECYDKASLKATEISEKTLKEVMNKIGFLMK